VDGLVHRCGGPLRLLGKIQHRGGISGRYSSSITASQLPARIKHLEEQRSRLLDRGKEGCVIGHRYPTRL
jgi:hypothetical protein